MRRILISIALIFFVLTICACSGMKVKRSVVDDNIFFSSSKPKIRIKIGPLFKLDKEDKKSVLALCSRSGAEKSSNVKIDQYVFSGSGSKKNKLVMIQFQELMSPKWQFTRTLFRANNMFDSGSIKIHGKSYQYMVYAFLKKNGTYNIVRVYGRRVGANNNAMIRIFYLERVTGNWSNLKMLSPKQQTHLLTFIEAGQKDIEILK